MSVVRLQHAGKRYGRTWALRDVDLEVADAVVLGLVGPNGAGKSTLLHLLVGLAAADEGSVAVLGAPAGSASTLPDLAFVAQDAPLPRRMRICELVDACRRLNPRWDRTVVDARVAELDLDPRSRIGNMSGGQRAQVALALALSKRPRLLVLDEPVASLDPLARRAFLGALMGAVADGGLTVVYSTHLLDDLERACDHLAVLGRGALRLDASIDDVLADHVLITGPADREVPPNVAPISTAEAGRQVQHVARCAGPVLDPSWTVRPATLEEIVFAHLAEPTAPAPRRLDLVS